MTTNCEKRNAESTPAIIFEGVSKTFIPKGRRQVVQAVRDITFSVDPKKFVAILGPSGCGKTTLLRMASGLIKSDAGFLQVFGKTPTPGPNIGYVFQTFRLIPWASVQQNVEFSLKSTNLSAKERRERAVYYIDLVGLSKFANAFPLELSGGMKQRVALARALSTEPSVLLMDEPFASIDAQTRELLQIELMRFWTALKPAVLFVTHSVDEAILLADEIILMCPRPGQIVEKIDVKLERPRWTYDVRTEQRYIGLRSYLSERMRELVMSDPSSEFYGRDLTSPY
jgi:NitT/TauT family transport system ATP-binding protein